MNLLFIFTDQQQRFALGCMGNPDVRTPRLDALAREGMLFRNAYSNCPICTPFRKNLLTGLYTSQFGHFGNAGALPAGHPTLADALNAGGYRTSYVGKWHIGGNGNIPIPRAIQGGFTEFLGYQCYNGFRDNIWFFDEHGTKHVFDGHRTNITTDLAIHRLQRLSGKPFALFVSYQAPHYPVQPAPEFEEMYAGVRITRRPNCRDVEPYTRTWSPPSPWPPDSCPDFQKYGGDLDEYIRLYYAMCTQVDANVGRLLDTLDSLGRRDDTAVIFTSDHGDMQGSHGLINKCQPYEESSGIPLIVRVPGGARNAVSDALVSGIDYYPTCLDYAGLTAPRPLPGCSFAPLTLGRPDTAARTVFSEMADWIMVRHGALKMTVRRENLAVLSLHDLERDPYELNNLAKDPATASRQNELLDRVRQWQDYVRSTAVKTEHA